MVFSLEILRVSGRLNGVLGEPRATRGELRKGSEGPSLWEGVRPPCRASHAKPTRGACTLRWISAARRVPLAAEARSFSAGAGCVARCAPERKRKGMGGLTAMAALRLVHWPIQETTFQAAVQVRRRRRHREGRAGLVFFAVPRLVYW